jgi:hypothetical protein
MGEAKRRKIIQGQILEFAKAGLVHGAAGTAMENHTPEQLVAWISKTGQEEVLLASLARGENVIVTGAEPSSKLFGGAGIGPQLLNALQLCHSVPDLGCEVYSMPYGDDEILRNDREWFEQNPGRQLRMRELISAVFGVGRPNEKKDARVIVVCLDRDMGLRARFFIVADAGHPDLMCEKDDRGIAELAIRLSRFYDIPEKYTGTPSASLH